MAVYIGNDPELTARQRRDFQAHLQACPVCAKDYQDSKFAIDLVGQYWTADENTIELQQETDVQRPAMTVRQSWQDLLDRCPDLAQCVRRQKRLRLFHQVAAVAACLAIGLFGWGVLSLCLQREPDQGPIARQVASMPKPTIKIELVLQDGGIGIPANRQIASADKLKTLVINDKHRLVMNSNTSLLIEPMVEDKLSGCMVKLVSGQIFTDVQHDGNPFVVDTRHGRAIITGTAFDIKVTDNSTTLVVSKGAVRLQSDKGSVSVEAGYLCQIADNLAPRRPVACDTIKLTAWAVEEKVRVKLAQIVPDLTRPDLQELCKPSLTLRSELQDIDYKQWLEETMDWFKQEFPWIFQLQSALANEGIQIDYPEVFIRSGAIRRFVYPASTSDRINFPNLKPLVKLAGQYGFDKQWLSNNVPAAKSTPARAGLTGGEAFEKWSSCFQAAKKAPKRLDAGLLLNSLRAGSSLANTRTLVWLAINNGKLVFNTADQAKVLALLEQQVNIVTELTGRIIELFWMNHDHCCDQCWQLLDKITEDIDQISGIQTKIKDYRI